MKILKKKKYRGNQSYLPTQTGMTLVELMVVLAIFLIVAGLTIFDYGRFRSSASLQNLSDDIALSIRRAQNYAIGVQSNKSVFSYGYGIHFSTALPVLSNARAGSNKSFVIFNDLNSNNIYDHATSPSTICNSNIIIADGDECVDMLNITSADTVHLICPNGNNCIPGSVDITFLRPNPDATICAFDENGRVITSFGLGKDVVVDSDVKSDILPILDDSSSSVVGANPLLDNGGGEDIFNSSICSPLSSVDIVVKNDQSGNTKVITVSRVGQISIK